MKNVVNYMEIWVKEFMEEALNKMDVCKCEKCKRDIYTLALNNLKPYYVSTELGSVMAKLESTKQQVETDIIVQVTAAINKVSINPKHNI